MVSLASSLAGAPAMWARAGVSAARPPEAASSRAATPAPSAETDSRSEAAPALYDRLGKLSGGNEDAAAARQRASDKVAELKKRMKWLKAMMVGASPAQRKALARQLGQIASELKSAVKGYADAGGGQAAQQPGGSAKAASGDAAAPASTPPAQTSAAAAGQTDSQADAAQPAAASGGEHSDFVRDAKELAGDIKRTLDMLKRKLRRQSVVVVRQVEKTLGQVGKMLTALGGDSGNAGAAPGGLAGALAQVVSAIGAAMGVHLGGSGAPGA